MKVVVSLQPIPLVPLTVYVVVAEGWATTVAPAVALRPVDGLQLKLFAPEAVSVVLFPAQMEVVPAMVTTGTAFTCTVT